MGPGQWHHPVDKCTQGEFMASSWSKVGHCFGKFAVLVAVPGRQANSWDRMVWQGGHLLSVGSWEGARQRTDGQGGPRGVRMFCLNIWSSEREVPWE